MGSIRKFWGLSTRAQILLVRAACLVGVIRLGLWLLPFRTLRRLLTRVSRSAVESQDRDKGAIDSVVWAVNVTSRYIPKATCLTQAMATQVLLLQRGYSADLRIGVTKGESGLVQAHAWVESEGKIVIGGADSALRFTLMTPLDTKLRGG